MDCGRFFITELFESIHAGGGGDFVLFPVVNACLGPSAPAVRSVREQSGPLTFPPPVGASRATPAQAVVSPVYFHDAPSVNLYRTRV